MKILHVSPSLGPEGGGIVTVVNNLTKALARKGISVSVFASSENLGTPYRQKGLDGVDVRNFPVDSFSKFWPGYSVGLTRALNREAHRFDLIHIHGLWHYPNFVAYRAAKKADKPFVVSTHGKLEPWCLGYKAFKKNIYAALVQRRILNEASALFAVTGEEVKNVSRFAANRNIFQVRNGVDEKEFQSLPERKRFERSHPELEGKKVILFLGRIHPVKGLDILAKAIGELLKTRSDIQLVIAGPDHKGYRKKIEELLKAKNAFGNTTFTGMLQGDDKLAALSRADIFILPSYSEIMGLGTLEAMACGLPVIITTGCNFYDAEKAGAGFVANPDPHSISSVIKTLIDDDALCKKMGQAGREMIIQNFTWGHISNRVSTIYKEIIRTR